MNTSEKIAYLKGLAEGVGLTKDSKENKLFAAIIDVLDSVARDLEDLEETTLELSEEMDAISDDLSDVESIVFDEDECCCDDDCCCGDECCCGDDDCCGDECCCDDDTLFYEVTCPVCGNTLTLEESVLELGSVKCPQCGELLEFDFECDDCCGDDDCCCDGEGSDEGSCCCEHKE